MSSLFDIALVEPEIPQNTGNIGRLALGLGCTLHLVHPLGFSLSQKAVRRAGLDYWKDVSLVEHEDISQFLQNTASRPLYLFSTKATQSYKKAQFAPGSILVFGPETRGLGQDLRDAYPCFQIPMIGPIRSLNLSNAVAVASYEAFHQLHGM